MHPLRQIIKELERDFNNEFELVHAKIEAVVRFITGEESTPAPGPMFNRNPSPEHNIDGVAHDLAPVYEHVDPEIAEAVTEAEQ